MFLFMLNTGLRRMEIQQLRWSDYTATSEGAFIHIRNSKTKAGKRDVPLVAAARSIIDRQGKKSEYIFSSHEKMVSDTELRRYYDKLRTKCMIPTLTNHVLRHTFATRCIEKGVSVKAVAQLLGHSKPDYALQIYVQHEQHVLLQEIFKLEQDQDTD